LLTWSDVNRFHCKEMIPYQVITNKLFPYGDSLNLQIQIKKLGCYLSDIIVFKLSNVVSVNQILWIKRKEVTIKYQDICGQITKQIEIYLDLKSTRI